MASALRVETESVLPEELGAPAIRDLLPFVLILVAHVPLLSVYLQQLWDRPHYQFFPLVLLASGYLTAIRWPERSLPTRRAIVLSRSLLAVSVCLLALAFTRFSPLVCYLSGVLIAGAFLLRFGIPALGPWLLLLLLVRIPYGHDVALIQWMQRLTTRLSATAMEVIGVEFLTEGNVLVFPLRSLFVEEACSGVVSMLAIVACAGIAAVWWQRSLLHTIVLMASGVFWAGGMNVLRVVSIAIALDSYGIDLTEGWRHETVGLCVFAVSLAVLLSTDRMLLFLLRPIQSNPLASYWVYVENNRLITLWNRLTRSAHEEDGEDVYGAFAQDWDNPEDSHDTLPVFEPSPPPIRPARPWEWAFVPLFVLLAGTQVVAGIGPFSVAPTILPTALALAADDLPEDFHGWRKTDFEVLSRDSSSAFGEHSRSWTLEKGPLVVTLSLDFVFPEWHALTACYEGTGWESQWCARLAADRTDTEAFFAEPNGQHAYLIYNLVDAEGKNYAAPGGSFLHPQLRRILKAEATRFTLPSYYQVQALAGIPHETLSAADRREVIQLFTRFQEHMIAKLTDRPATVLPSAE
jgi:exosortase